MYMFFVVCFLMVISVQVATLSMVKIENQHVRKELNVSKGIANEQYKLMPDTDFFKVTPEESRHHFEELRKLQHQICRRKKVEIAVTTVVTCSDLLINLRIEVI